jgi:Holliday junction resolvase
MHTKTKGTIAEMAVVACLLEKGWKVLLPVGENQRYDLVAERGG